MARVIETDPKQRSPHAGRFRRYPEYRDSGVEWIGEVPAHWQVTRTKFVARLRSGHTPSRQVPEYWTDCTIPWFGLSDVWQIREGNIEYVTETSEKISQLGLDNSAARLLPQGTVILSRTASVGFSAILGTEMATTQDFVNWVCGPRILPEYLLYVFRSMQHEFTRLTMGSTHQTIYMPDVGKFSTPLPTLDEQGKIVTFIRRRTKTIDKLIAHKEHLVALLAERRRALIARTITSGLTLGEHTRRSDPILGLIPRHWDIKRLWHLTAPARQIMYGIVLPGPHVENGVPIVKGGDVAAGRLRLDRLNRTTAEIERGYVRSRLRGGDIVVAIRGSIGEVGIVPEELTGANLTQDAARVSYTAATNGRWLRYAMVAAPVFAQLDAGAVGATIRGINIRDLKRALIPVPPLNEQVAIADYLDVEIEALDRLATAVRTGIMNLQEIRTSLISRAVTGKIDMRAIPT